MVSYSLKFICYIYSFVYKIFKFHIKIIKFSVHKKSCFKYIFTGPTLRESVSVDLGGKGTPQVQLFKINIPAGDPCGAMDHTVRSTRSLFLSYNVLYQKFTHFLFQIQFLFKKQTQFVNWIKTEEFWLELEKRPQDWCWAFLSPYSCVRSSSRNPLFEDQCQQYPHVNPIK